MVNYLNDSTSTTGTATSSYLDTGGTTGTLSSQDYMWINTTTTTTRTTRKLLVRMPKNWSKRDQDAFVNLVNKDTNTGWKVEMIISGDVELVDHSIEVVSMQSFVDILSARATESDRKTINNFFENKKDD